MDLGERLAAQRQGLLGFPGFGQESAPLPSGNPVLPPDVAEGFMQDRLTDQRTGAQMSALLTGSVSQLADTMDHKVDTVLRSVLTGLASSALTQLKEGPVTGGAGGPGTPRTAPLTAAPSPETPQTPRVAEARDGGAPDAKGDLNPSAISQYKEGLASGQEMTMGKAAKSAIGVGARYFSDRPTFWKTETRDGKQTLVQYASDEEGNPQEMRAVSEGDAGYGFTAAKVRAGAYVGGSLASMAEGGGMAGTLGTVVSKAAGPIGIAVGTGLAVGHGLEKQNKAAAGYRSAFGEQGTGTFAAQERFGEFMAGLGGFGTIGGDRAREQYRAASELGLRDTSREQATDFSSDMFMRFGMDTSESMKIVEQAVTQGNVSLTQFSEAITEVSRSAVEAGRSSAEAIRGFVDAQNYVAKNITGGAASIGVAQQVTGVTEGMSRGLAESLGGAEGVAQSLLSQDNTMRVAAMSGEQDPLAAWWRAQDPDTAEAQAARTMEATGDQIVELIASVMGMGAPDLKRRVQRLTGGKMPAQSGAGGMYAIFERLSGGTDAAAGIMSLVMTHVVQFFDMKPDTTKVLELFFKACLTGFKPPEAPKDKTGGGISDKTASTPYKAGGGNSDLLASRLGIANVTTETGVVTTGAPTDEAAFEEYSERVDRYGGGGNKAVEALLSSSNRDKIEKAAHVDDLSDVKYRVKNPKTGKAVDLSLAEILKRGSAYTSQVSGDRAPIVNSDDPNAAPTALSVVLELDGEAADLFRQKKGPSDEQRAGVPPSGNRNPSTIPRWGGR